MLAISMFLVPVLFGSPFFVLLYKCVCSFTCRLCVDHYTHRNTEYQGVGIWCGQLATDPNIYCHKMVNEASKAEKLYHNFYPDIPEIIKDLRPSFQSFQGAGVVTTVNDGVQGLMALASLARLLMSWPFSRAGPQCLTEAIRGKRSGQA